MTVIGRKRWPRLQRTFLSKTLVLTDFDEWIEAEIVRRASAPRA